MYMYIIIYYCIKLILCDTTHRTYILIYKWEVILCLLGLSSAFDTLKHTNLLQRLHDIGIKGSALEWFCSYLKDRTTSIKVNN